MNAGRDESVGTGGFIDQRARREYALLCLATFLIFFTNAHAALLAVVFQSHGLQLDDVGVILSSYGVPVVIFTLLTGAVAGRIGALMTLKIGVFIMVLAFVSLQWTADAFFPALCSRVLQGVGYGFLFAPLMTYAQSRLSNQRFVYLLGFFSSMAPLAQAFGPPWADYIFFTFGDRYLFLIGVIPALTGFGLLFLLLGETTVPVTSLFNFRLKALKGKGVGIVAVFVSGSIFGFLASFMAGALHEKALAIGWFFVASTAAMFTTRFLGLNHFGRFDLRFIVAAGLILMGVGFAIVAFGTLAVHVALGGLVFGVGYSVVYPVLSAWISEGLPAGERSGPQALFNAAFNAGLLLMPLPVSYLIGWFGYSGALLCLAALGWAMAATLFVSNQRNSIID
jgi:MFS family permease